MNTSSVSITVQMAFHREVEVCFRLIPAISRTVENGCNLFSDPEFEPDVTIRDITIADVMEALRMHKHSVLGLGGRPGLPPRAASTAEVVAALRKRLKSFIPWWEAQQKRER